MVLQAGRALDVLVAEKVMGWGPIEPPSPHEPVAFQKRYWENYSDHRTLPADHPLSGLAVSVPRYSTDIAAAWKIVDALRERRIGGAEMRTALSLAHFYSGPMVAAAICRAALTAVENS